MKIFAVVVVVLAGVVTVAAARRAGIGPFANTLPMTLPSPHGLGQVAGPRDRVVPPGAWTNHRVVTFTAARANPKFRLQVELARNGAAAPNAPAATGRLDGSKIIGPSVTIRHLDSGSYQWWARFYNGSAISPWKADSGGTAFKIDFNRPSTPIITSSSNPDQSKVYRSGTFDASWSSSDSASGIAGYRYSISNAGATHRTWTTGTSLAETGLGSGVYVLTVQSRDNAGTWSLPAKYTVRINNTQPSICSNCYGFNRFTFNPHYSNMTLSYQVNEPVTVRIGIYSQSNNQLERLVVQHATTKDQILHYVWHGRDNHGNRVPAGSYFYVVHLIDGYGNSASYTYSNLQVIHKVIVVSISQQKLWAYQDGKVVASTLVTTGNVHCCATPPGLYTILASYHPFTFRSPFPPGSFYYYPPSGVQYAMLFDTRGFYIHDAPWRTSYGPGTNQTVGHPGSFDTGTHGCVNVPLATEQFLYQWAPVGTPVKILG